MNRMIQLICCVVASGLGTGFAPLSPGTTGSIVACLGWLLIPGSDSATVIIALMILGLSGFYASSRVMKNMPADADPQWIVIDEWCGMWIALACCPSRSIEWTGAAFILFRFFDISKLGPVGWAERAPGAAGVMLDDIVAGLCAGLLLLAARIISA